MKAVASFAVLVALGAMVSPETARASSEASDKASGPSSERTIGRDAMAQADVQQPPKARTRIRVRLLYGRQPFSSPYPPTYDIRYPGPNASRECAVRYVQEYRPSGTVIVPRMHCWWVRG